MSLPRNRPVLYFAWWCPWCHRELAVLQRYGDLGRITLVSLYLNASEKGGKPVVIWDFQDGVRVTEVGFQQAGVYMPPNHVLYVMPNSPLNKIIAGVLVWIERTAFGRYVLNGTPGESAVWPSVLGYVQKVEVRVFDTGNLQTRNLNVIETAGKCIIFSPEYMVDSLDVFRVDRRLQRSSVHATTLPYGSHPPTGSAKIEQPRREPQKRGWTCDRLVGLLDGLLQLPVLSYCRSPTRKMNAAMPTQ